MSRRDAWIFFILLGIALFIGTLMPNSWRQYLQQATHMPVGLSSWGAHFLVFTTIALVLKMRPIFLKLWVVLSITMTLALLSEGLQFFAENRHPRLIDIGIDMSGTLFGLVIAYCVHSIFTRHKHE